MSNLEELIEGARQWFDAGFCVVPSHEDGGKRPFGNWRKYQDERLPWDDLEKLLKSERFTGIGVITGAVSGNVEMIELEGPNDFALENLQIVLRYAREIDERDGDGVINAELLMSRLVAGCSEVSGSGGLHFFVRSHSDALPNTKLAQVPNPATPGIPKVIAETRGEGGFVIVAPSPGRRGHADGARYRFVNGAPGQVPVVSAEDRDVLHELFRGALDRSAELIVPVSVARERLTVSPADPGSPFDEYRVRATWDEVLLPHGWQRGHTSADDGRTHWTRPGKDPRDGTSATTLEDGPMHIFSSNAGLPLGPLSKGSVYAHLNHGGDLSAASRALRDAGYGGAEAVDLRSIEFPSTADDAVVDGWRDRVKGEFPAIDWEQLWASEQENEWIIEPILGARRYAALYSQPKVGKSLVMLEAAVKASLGERMFGEEPKRPRRILYIDFENDPQSDTRERLIDMGYTPDMLSNFVMLSFPVMDGFDTAAGAEQLLAVALAYEAEAVIIDTVSRAVRGEENDNDTWLNLYRHAGLKMKQNGIAVLRLDHAGKDDSRGARGGSAKSGDVDAVWRMSRKTDTTFALECDISRFPIPEDTIMYKRELNPLRHVALSNGLRDTRNEILGWMAELGMSKSEDLTVRPVEQALRANGHRLSAGLVTAELLERYKNTPNSWTPQVLDGAG